MAMKPGSGLNDRLAWRRWVMLGLTLFLGVGLTLAGFLLSRELERERTLAALAAKATDYHKRLQSEVQKAIQSTMAVRALYDSSEGVSRAEFKTFAKQIMRMEPGVAALEWVPRVPHAQREKIVAAARRDGLAEFRITERSAQGPLQKAAARREYFPVYFVEPLQGNRYALGFDAASNPKRLKALHKARDTGKMVATGGVQLVRESGGRVGLVVFGPVYKYGVANNTLEERRRNLRGYVVGIFRVADLVENSLAGTAPAGIDFTVYDLEKGKAPKRLYFHASRTAQTRSQNADATGSDEICRKCSFLVNVADRNWQVAYTARPWFAEKNRTMLPWMVLVAGLLATLVLLLSELALLKRDVHLGRTNEQLVEDIAERRRLAEEKAVMAEVLQLINNATGRRELLSSILDPLRNWAGCEAVGIRLREGDDFTYYETKGFPQSFVQLENSLCNRGENGEILRDAEQRPILDCMCGNILAGRVDPSKAFFTNGGSFWSSCTTDLLATTTEADRQARTRNTCNGAGYESVALVPLRAGGETFGLIQLNDKQKGRFTEEKIALIERLADSVAGYLAKLQAEDALRRSDERYRNIVDAAYEGIWMVDADYRTTFVNARVSEILGYPVSEIMGRDASEFMVEEELGEHEAAAAQRRDGKPGQYQHCLRRKDGSLCWCLVSARPLFDEDGNFAGSVGMFSDITEQKLAEDQRELLLRQWRLALDAARMGWWNYDPVHDTSTWDDRYAEIFQVSGYQSPNEEVMKRLHPDDIPRVWAQVEAALDPKNPQPYSTEYRLILPNGALRWVEAHGLAVFQGEGEDRRAVSFSGTVADVTERKQALEQLAKSEQRYRLLAENTLDVIWTMNLNLEFTYVNNAILPMTGYTPEEWIGTRLVDHCHAEDFAMMAGIIAEEAAKGPHGEGVIFEAAMLKKNGDPFMVEIHGRIIFDEQGQPVALQGATRDTTSRKKAEEEKQKSQQQFRAAFESAPEGMALVDHERLFFMVNPRLCEILGYSEDELLGKSFNIFTHPDDRQAGRERWAEIFRGESSVNRGEKRFIHKNGQAVWVLISNAAIKDAQGNTQYVLSHIYDITARRQMEQDLRLSEQKFAAAFQHSPMWVAISTVDQGRYIDVNETFLRDTGYKREEVIGRTAKDLNLRLDPAEREGMVRLLKERGNLRNIEVRRRLRSGEIRDMLLSAETLPTPGEEAMVVVLADITAMKKAQAEKEDLKAQLQQAQKMEAIGTMAGGIAHDFNNILAAILGYSELIRGNTKEGDENRAFIEQILAASNRAQRLVKQILTFGRKAELEARPVDLNRRVKETVELLRQTIPKMVSVELHLAEGLHLIKADPGQLEQIVMNLSTNAKDAMPDGGRLLFETADVFLDADYCRDHFEAEPGDYVRLQVSDTGHGMSREVLSHIFDPFFTTKELGKGTGLGLSSVYGIVKSHGGFIYCYSEPGHGTTFRIYFPALMADDAGGMNPERQEAPAAGGDETLLLVDDEAPLLDLGKRLLSRAGYRVITADRGEKALEIYRERGDEIDLVILDVSMPGLGGHKTLREIIKLDPRAKVVIASGYSANGQLKETLAAGAAGYIAKPFQRAELFKKLRDVLDGE